MIFKQIRDGCHFLVAVQVLLFIGFFALNVSAKEASVKESEFVCQGYNTIVHSDEMRLVSVCHGPYAELNRKKIEQWQDCYDSIIYERDKKKNRNTIIVDCSPVRYTQFRLINGVLDIKYYYDPYSGDGQEPFVLKSYDISRSSNTYKIVADLGSYTRQEIKETIQLMDVEISKPFDGRTYFNVIYSGFDKIRDFSVTDPIFSMKILNDYAARQVFDGEVSERLSLTIDDIELIKQANMSNRSIEPDKSDGRVKGDINCDGRDDFANMIYGNKQVKVIVTLSDGTKSNELEFGLGEPMYQSSLCGNKASLSAEKLSDLSDIFGENPKGYETSETCIGLRLSGGECDSMHIFWNHETDQLNWWRL